MGSILQTKKRYVGHMYEDVRDERPELDTKGIELVRRDSCPAVAKILERCLTTLFAERSLSAVRTFCQRQFARILANRVSVRDFMFAREVRLGSYRTATVPPAALVAAKCMAKDPRLEPARGERVRSAATSLLQTACPALLPVLPWPWCEALLGHLGQSPGRLIVAGAHPRRRHDVRCSPAPPPLGPVLCTSATTVVDEQRGGATSASVSEQTLRPGCPGRPHEAPRGHVVQVRFVVVHGEPGARLVDCVVHPQAFLAAGGRLQLHGQYYITKQILPALDRLFSLLGVDVHEWFGAMAKPQRLLPHKRPLCMLPSRATPAALPAST